MKYFSFLLLFSSFNLAASECEVELFSKVYRMNANQVLQARDLVKDSTCSPEISNKLATLVTSSEGVVGSDFLKTEIQKDFPDLSISFTNKKLSLMDLNLALKNQLLPNSNLFFSQARSLNGISTLGLAEGEQMSAVCDSCQNFGEKNIKVNIINIYIRIIFHKSNSVWIVSFIRCCE